MKTPGGTVLLIDPWFKHPAATDAAAVEKLGKIDFILITHGHFDHVGEAVEVAKRSGAKLVSGYELGATLVSQAGFPKDQVGFPTQGNIGGAFQLNDEVSATIVPAVHSSGFQKDDTSPFVAAGAPAGFVIQIKKGPTLYHTGDTDAFGDMKMIGERFKVDVMMACIGGHFTMDPKGAALAALLVKPGKVVPMHFGTFPVLKGTPAELARELKAKGSKAQLVELRVGETKAF